MASKVDYACAVERRPTTWDRFVQVVTRVLAYVGMLTVVVALTLGALYAYLDSLPSPLKPNPAKAQCGSCRKGMNK